MISFGNTNGEIVILLDSEGIKELKKYLDHLENKTDTHYHLMTPSWGGYELSEKYFSDMEIINQVRHQHIPEE